MSVYDHWNLLARAPRAVGLLPRTRILAGGKRSLTVLRCRSQKKICGAQGREGALHKEHKVGR